MLTSLSPRSAEEGEAPGVAATFKAVGVAGVGLTLAGVGLPMAISGPPATRIPPAAELAQANIDLNAITSRCGLQMSQLETNAPEG